jgi:Zn-dependent protease with chaperone function
MSRTGSGIFFDGHTNARHAVAVALRTDAVEISAPDGGILAAWPFSEIAPLTTPEGVLRLGRAKSKEVARLEIRDASLASELMGLAKRPDRTGLTDRRTRAKVACWGVAAVLSLGASAIWGVPYVAERVAPHLPVAAEIRLGDAVDGQVRRVLGAGNSDKPFECGAGPGHEAGRAAFAKLIGTLENAADLPVPVRAAVVRTPAVNAIALPGGRVYLFDGLLSQARSPDEIAGVLGHELGHVAHRDGTKSVLEAGGISLLFGMLLGDFTGGGAAVMAAQVVLRSSNSRDKEAAADAFGAALVSKVGGDPKALAGMFERLSGKGPQTPHFLLDHPDAKERATAIGQVAPPAAKKTLLTTQEWAALKRICS